MQANLSIQGAIPPPSGIAPEFTNSSYTSGGIVALSALFLTLSTVSLALRIYTRIRLLKAFFAEDYVIIAAWVFTAVSTAICLGEDSTTMPIQTNESLTRRAEQQRNGIGRHEWDVPLETFVQYKRWAAASIFIYISATALPKIAILMCYLRVFSNKKFRLGVYVVFAITIAYIITSCFVLLFQCHPAAKLWNMLIPGQCLLIPKLLATGIFNVTVDIMVLLVPVPMLMEWDVSIRQKLSTGGMFAIGSSTCIVSAVRNYYIARLLHTIDFTRAIVIPTSLSVVETNLSITCGCLMVMRPFLKRHIPFLFQLKPERVEQTSPHVANEEYPLTVLNVHVDARAKAGAGFGGINSSASWSWGQARETDTHTTAATATEDVEMGGAGGWPLGNNISSRTEGRSNIIEEMVK